MNPVNLRFSAFEVNFARRELFKNGTRLKIQVQPFEILCALLEHPGEVVSREELRRRLWPDNTFVEYEDSLNTAVRKLRAALSDSSDTPRYIETVARQGYRFIAPVLPAHSTSATAAIHHVPPQRTSIVGRERVTEDVCSEMRRGHVRLVTLTGVGGVGKTTLAQAVARRLSQEFPDGVAFVELAAIREPDLVASTVAQTLGINDIDRNPTSLKKHLSGRKMLLVLDNFEQVLAAGTLVSELLAAAPELKVLVTSRALLRLRDEREYVVPPLPAPETRAEVSVAELMAYGAVALFVERARAVKVNFDLNEENALTVASICGRLDGLPLAIELAAARVKLLSPRAILSRLDHRLKLLTGGSRDLPARQQTMSAAIEWSYELLNNEEKRLFRRLAVFAGGFTFEAAEKVLGEPDALERISSLVNQSLLVVGEAGADLRVQMLEVVREYALERLEASGEAEPTRQQHAAYFLALAEQAEPHLQGSQPAGWLTQLEQDYDNVRAALRWCLANDPKAAPRMAAAIRHFWTLQGYLTEGLGILKQVLNVAEGAGWTARCKLLNSAGNIAKHQGDYLAAHAMYEEGLNGARAAQDFPQVSSFCRGLAGLAMERGDHAAARGFVEQALAAARESNDRFGIARSYSMLGDLARLVDDYSSARKLFQEALRICNKIGNKYATSVILNNLAAADYGLGDYTAAEQHFSEALTMALEMGAHVMGHKIAISYALDGFAALAVWRGQAELAARLAGTAEHLRESMNFRIEPPERRFRELYLATLHTQLPTERFSNAYALGQMLKLEESIALAVGKKTTPS